MELLKLLIFLLILVGVLLAIYKAIVYAHLNLGKAFKSPILVWISRILLVISSCAVGVWFFSFSYYLSETKRVSGIPLPWAAWEYSNGYWLDFISPISLIFVPLDFIFGIGVTHFLAAFLLFAKNKLSNKQIANA